MGYGADKQFAIPEANVIHTLEHPSDGLITNYGKLDLVTEEYKKRRILGDIAVLSGTMSEDSIKYEVSAIISMPGLWGQLQAKLRRSEPLAIADLYVSEIEAESIGTTG